MLNSYTRKSGVIFADGSDRMDFFNRMSSNDLTNFPVNTFRKTVFTNDKGRIVDFVTLLSLEDKTIILTSPGREDILTSHLDKYIIMDDVKLDKPDEEFYKLTLWGDGLLEEAGKHFDIKKDNLISSPEDSLFIFYDDQKTVPVDFVSFVSIEEKLKDINRKFPDAKELSNEEFEVFRINNGIAEADNEINEQINPVECGLNDYISYTKGCYIGQEVISRLDSQGKVPKQMVKITSGNGILKDDKIFNGDSKEVGFISSTAKESGDSIGLGFIRSVNLDYDKDYFVSHDGNKTKIKISKVI